LNLKEDLSNKSTNVINDATSSSKYPSVKAIKDYVDASIITATPDATTTLKGKVQLAGDLTGSAALPRIATNAVTSSKILDGEIVNADISATAAIVDTKLATITTAGKVSNSATSATKLNTPNTIVLRDGSGNLAAGSITATGFTGPLTGNVTGNLTGNVTGNISGTAANVSGVVAIANGGTGSTTKNFVDLTTTQTVAGAKTFSSNVTGASFIKSGGTSSQFLKADGSVDNTSYLTSAGTAANVSGVVAIANGGTGSTTKNFVDLTTAQTVAGAKTFSSNVTGTSFIKSGGTSSQFLKADGSVDNTSYLTSAGTAANVSGVVAIANGGTGSTTKNFVDLTTAQTVAGDKTFTGNTTANSFIKSGGTSSEFLKADGSVDNTSYLTSAGTAANVSGTVAIANGGTGSTTQNFVYLTTTQTVAGDKTFTGNTTANSFIKTGGTSSEFLKAD
jgi:hypothetical protein